VSFFRPVVLALMRRVGTGTNVVTAANNVIDAIEAKLKK
jgi:hypothetical protein